MSSSEYDRKLDELERMLNDPDSKMEPEKVWVLLAELSSQSASAVAEIPTH